MRSDTLRIHLCFRFLLLVAVLQAIGCKTTQPNFSGEWTNTVDATDVVTGAKPDPSAANGSGGYAKITTSLSLGTNHRFLWRPVLWAGTWTADGDLVTLRPDKNYPSLALLNGYSKSKTNGVPNITLSYSADDRALRWTFGSQERNTKIIMTFTRKG